MFSPNRLSVTGAALFVLSGCVVLYDGHYQIRGTVRRDSVGTWVPVPGAKVVVPPNKHSTGAETTTNADGTFLLHYRFYGGGIFPFGLFCADDGDPVVEASAPGLPLCSAKAREASMSSCVWRRPCAMPDPRHHCVALDILLGEPPFEGSDATQNPEGLEPGVPR